MHFTWRVGYEESVCMHSEFSDCYIRRKTVKKGNFSWKFNYSGEEQRPFYGIVTGDVTK